MRGAENIVGKGENAGYQHFLLFPQCFQRLSFSGPLKVGVVWYKVKADNFACLMCTCTHKKNKSQEVVILNSRYNK